MPPARSPLLRALRIGGLAVGCVLLGVIAGRQLGRDVDEPLWQETMPASGRAPVAVGAFPATFADLVELARPGIVSVRSVIPEPATPTAEERLDPDSGLLSNRSSHKNGSGFVVHADGLVVTSLHVVEAASEIEVQIAGHRPQHAVLVGADVGADLALLRLDKPPPDLHALALGDSESLRAGDWIVALGNPFGLAQTVTAGVVSFVGRHLPHNDIAVTSGFVQFSAPVNPGSSGGPVLALDGRVIGVTTRAAVEAQGISFAVPARTLKWSLAEMQRSYDGRVRRGYLGIEFASLLPDPETGAPRPGAMILRVMQDGPAKAAGIRCGDIVLEVDGQPIVDANCLHDRIVSGAPGALLAMQVLHQGGVPDSIQAVLSEMRRLPSSLTWN